MYASTLSKGLGVSAPSPFIVCFAQLYKGYLVWMPPYFVAAYSCTWNVAALLALRLVAASAVALLQSSKRYTSQILSQFILLDIQDIRKIRKKQEENTENKCPPSIAAVFTVSKTIKTAQIFWNQGLYFQKIEKTK